jgi:sugar O-acyltransferase (sialic acid O-acetyltransferase NeuD family)
MKKIALLGYSGHSYVVADCAIENKFQIIGYYDLKINNDNPFQLEYLGSDDCIIAKDDVFYFPSVGSNAIRQQMMLAIEEKKCLTINLIHPFSFLTKSSKIGLGNLISSGVNINALTKIGKGCIINTGAIIEHECMIDDFVHIGPGAVLAGNVRIGSNTFIGANVAVRQGISIGENVVVGAGSVVVKNIPDNETWVGNPAKLLKR